MGYKEDKEAFVSNLHGTSMAEIALVSCVLPAGLFLRAAIWRAVGGAAVARLPAPAVWLLEFATVALPPLLSLIASEHVLAVAAGAVALGCGLNALVAPGGGGSAAEEEARRAAALSARQKYHVAVFRATMMLTTCVCILAVDFHVFPRRFAKVETYGTGVMDIGVGAFVFANGLVSCTASSTAAVAGTAAERRCGVLNAALRSAGPLLVLGGGRLVSIKASGYPEHVTEYGVHWNFFLTLAAVALCTAAAAPPAALAAATAAALLCAHNFCLSVWPGWESWVVSEQRDYSSLLDMNKEGIVSLPSYWAIYLVGQVAGRALLLEPPPPPPAAGAAVIAAAAAAAAGVRSTATRSGSRGGNRSRSPSPGGGKRSRSPNPNRKVRQRQRQRQQQLGGVSVSPEEQLDAVAAWRRRSLQLGVAVGLLWLCTLLCVSEPSSAAESSGGGLVFGTGLGLGLRPSRRLLNLPYTLWLLAQCGSWLLAFLLLDLHAPPVPCELKDRGLDLVIAISGQGHLLPFFLTANLLTGAVNLSIETLHVGDRDAALILLLYLSLLCAGVTAVAVRKANYQSRRKKA